jgi:hypothetical protein
VSTYDASVLNPPRPSDETWAINATRFYLKDRDGSQYEDAELLMTLLGNSFIVDDVTYFRPHIAAADLVDSDPDRAMSESLLGASISLREPNQVSRAIRKAGKWIDDFIAAESGMHPPSRLILNPTF